MTIQPAGSGRTPVLSESRSQCGGCNDLFNSTTAFDRHRVGAFETPDTPCQRRCLTPAEMTSKGWLRNEAGFWITSVRQAFATGLEPSPYTSAATHGAEVTQ